MVGAWRITSTVYLDSRRLYCRTPEKWFGGDFSVKWFGFRPESQSYRPKVGVTDQKSEIQPGRPPESEPNRPKTGPEWGLGASTETPLKAFLNPPKVQCWRAEITRGFSTSTGNHFWEISGIFWENYYQYWFLPVLRPRRVSTSSGNKSVSHMGVGSWRGINQELANFWATLCTPRLSIITFIFKFFKLIRIRHYISVTLQ